MHIKAKLYDELPKEQKHTTLVQKLAKDGQYEMVAVPVNRPCDWCGELVDVGYIHNGSCLAEDTKFWLDVLYD